MNLNYFLEFILSQAQDSIRKIMRLSFLVGDVGRCAKNIKTN
jgi:hypothetical protein